MAEEPEFIFPTFQERHLELTAALTIEELDMLARVLGSGSARMMTTVYQRLKQEASEQGVINVDHPDLSSLADWRAELTRADRHLDARRRIGF